MSATVTAAAEKTAKKNGVENGNSSRFLHPTGCKRRKKVHNGPQWNGLIEEGRGRLWYNVRVRNRRFGDQKCQLMDGGGKLVYIHIPPPD